MKTPLSTGKLVTFIVMLSMIAALLPAQTVFGQTNTRTFTAVADAHVDKSQPKTNFGAKTYLTLDYSPVTISYLSFDVSGLNGATITSAKLRLYSLYAGTNLVARKALSPFDEGAITFNNAPKRGTTALSKISSFGANRWVTLNVTAAVKKEGRINLAVNTSTKKAFSFASRERSGGAYAPQLILTLKAPAAPTATKAPTKVPTKTPTKAPTKAPTAVPTKAPTKAPTAAPTKAPTAAPTAPSSSGPMPYNVAGSWKLKFADDFNGSSLDLNKWQPNWLASNNTDITKPINSKELSCYDPAQVSMANGSLKLSAVQRSCKASNGTTYNYASGIVTSRPHFTFNYGFMEARVWVDGSTSIKNWPAFWADGTGTWPTTGEIDVFEGLSGKASWHYHYGSTSSPQQVGGYPSLSSPGGWHIFGADWEPGSIKFYYDGKLVGTVTSGVVNSSMFIILNYGLSSSTPVSVPSNFLVDYVRVWQH